MGKATLLYDSRAGVVAVEKAEMSKL